MVVVHPKTACKNNSKKAYNDGQNNGKAEGLFFPHPPDAIAQLLHKTISSKKKNTSYLFSQ